MYLSSNGSQKYYPENTVSNYRVKLPFPIKVKFQYEVAITELNYLCSFKTFSAKSTDNIIKIQRSDSESKEIQIRDMHYSDIFHLVQAIQAELKENQIRFVSIKYFEVKKWFELMLVQNVHCKYLTSSQKY
jgi:hypothetical protein